MNTLTPFPKPGYKALRKGRVSLRGQTYLVTFATLDRRPVFAHANVARVASKSLTDPRLWRNASLLAWVLMPDHWHGLIELGAEESLPAIVKKLTTNIARRIRLACPGIPSVWEKGFHDRALRAEDDLKAAARYLVRNPVRAGLVERIGDYPYWDAVWL